MRIKCLENEALSLNDFEAILAIPTLDERISYLKNKGINVSSGKVDEIFKKQEKELLEFVKELIGSLDCLNFILIRKDFMNLKAVVRCVLKDINAKDFLDDLSLIDPNLMINAIKEQQFNLLPEYIRNISKESFETLLKTNDACFTDAIIDAEMFKVLLEVSKKSKLSIIKNYVELLSVYANLNIALRSIKLRRNDVFFLNRSLIPCKTFDTQYLIDYCIKGKEPLVNYLNSVVYYDFSLFHYKEDKDYLNTWFDSSLTCIINKEKSDYFTLNSVIAYVLSRYLEFKKIKMILGSESYTDEQRNSIRERLKTI